MVGEGRSEGDGAIAGRHCSAPPRHQAPVCNTQKKVLVHLWCNSCSKCYAMNCFGAYFTHFTYVPQPGVGWGAMRCTVLAHMFDATQLYLRTCSMLRNCTCAHVRCYAIALSACVRCYAMALAHVLDATQLHLRTCSMLRNWTCAHVRCYAIALARMLDATQLHLRTRSMLRNCTWAHVYAIALAHMFDATQLHLRTCSMLRNCTVEFSCYQ